MADVLFKELNLRYLWPDETTKFELRIFDNFVSVIGSFVGVEPVKQRKHLTIKQLTLGVCSGLKGRHLTQAKSEVKRLICKRCSMPEDKAEEQGVEQERRNRRLRNEQTDFDADGVLFDLRKDDLGTIVAEVAAQTGEDPQKSRTKKDMIEWLTSETRLSCTRGILRDWLEQRREIEDKRRMEALKQFGM